ALKGYLRLHGWSTAKVVQRKYGHNLQELYKACESEGLTIHGEQRSSISNVISLLDESNRDQGLRYFTRRSQQFPELGWVVEVIRNTAPLVVPAPPAVDPDADNPGPAVKLDFTISKPQPQ